MSDCKKPKEQAGFRRPYDGRNWLSKHPSIIIIAHHTHMHGMQAEGAKEKKIARTQLDLTAKGAGLVSSAKLTYHRLQRCYSSSVVEPTVSGGENKIHAGIPARSR